MLHGDRPSCVSVVQHAGLTLVPLNRVEQAHRVARCVHRVMIACISDVSWVISTPRAPVPASLHLEALQLKPRAISSGDREILFLEVTNHQLDMFQTYSEVLCLNYHFFSRTRMSSVNTLNPQPGYINLEP